MTSEGSNKVMRQSFNGKNPVDRQRRRKKEGMIEEEGNLETEK